MFFSAPRSALRALVALGLAPVLILGTLLAAAPAQAQRVKPDFFGMHDTWITNGWVPTVRTGSTRLWDTGTAWRQIETEPNEWDWSKLDKAVDTARAAGIRPLLVLGQTPSFYATDDPDTYEAYGDGATSMPKLKMWKRYVKKVAKRYKTSIDYQIWNEPNVVNYWSGTPSQMAKLTATGSKQIKRYAGKKAKVVAPAFPLRLKSQRNWYAKYWASKFGGKNVSSYVNVVSANLYPLANQGPENSMKLMRFAKKALPKAARSKPMWNTEINYGLLGGPTATDIPAEQEAAFVARTIVLNAASPIKRMYWFKWGVGHIANTHLVDDDRKTLTRAGHTWNVVRSWVVKTNVKNCKVARKGRLKGMYTCTAVKGKKEVRRIYWKPKGATVKLRTHKTTKRWSDMDGNVTTGRARLTISDNPVMVASRK